MKQTIEEATNKNPKSTKKKSQMKFGVKKSNINLDLHKLFMKKKCIVGIYRTKNIVQWVEWNLGVEHDGAENTSIFHGLTEIVKCFLVVGMGSMGEVEASDVHARSEKLLSHLYRSRCWSKRTHDLRFWLVIQTLLWSLFCNYLFFWLHLSYRHNLWVVDL